MTLESNTKFEVKLTCSLENDMKNLERITRALKSLKIGTFIWSFYPK